MQRTNKAITAGLVIALILMTIGTVIFYSNTGKYKKTAETELLRHDSLLAVKQLLEKEISDQKDNAINLNNKINSLDALLATSNINLNQKDKDIAKMTKDIASVTSLKKQLSNTKKDIAGLENKLSALSSEKNQWVIEKESLNKTISDLQKQLAEKNNFPVMADNFRIEIQKRNSNKLTARARWTKNILISFNISGKKDGDHSNIYIAITSPKGKSISTKEKKQVKITSNGELKEIISVKSETADFSKSQRITIPLEISEKMNESGIYKVELYTDNGLFGNAQFRLM